MLFIAKPRIDSSRNDNELHVIYGRPITVWCPATGNPPPKIRWYRNGNEITEDEIRSNKYRILDHGHGLEISAAVSVDNGVWTCEATNAAGSNHLEIDLDVWCK